MAKIDDPMAAEFETALGGLKIERLAALTEAAGLQVSMQSLLHNEAQRVENKLGPQHRRTQELKASLENNLRATRALEVELQLTRINVPEVAEGAALVHGRIVDEDGLGIDRLVVSLVNRSGAPARDSGEQTTDISGYFAIALESNAVDRLLKQYSDGIFLAVFTPRRRLIHQEPKPLTLAHDSQVEVEIRIDRATLTATPSTPPTTIATPNLIGMTESEGLAALEKSGLKLGERKTKVAPDQVGRVLDQSPAAGTRVESGSSVSLVIGVQSGSIKVPSLIGRKLKDAKAELTKLGLILGRISGPSPSDESIVKDQDPKPDAEIASGTPVNLVVAPPAPYGIKEIVARMSTDEAFAEIGISTGKIEKRLRKTVETNEQLASLLESPDPDLKTNLGLPNINAARAFKSVLRKALEEIKQ